MTRRVRILPKLAPAISRYWQIIFQQAKRLGQLCGTLRWRDSAIVFVLKECPSQEDDNRQHWLGLLDLFYVRREECELLGFTNRVKAAGRGAPEIWWHESTKSQLLLHCQCWDLTKRYLQITDFIYSLASKIGRCKSLHFASFCIGLSSLGSM